MIAMIVTLSGSEQMIDKRFEQIDHRIDSVEENLNHRIDSLGDLKIFSRKSAPNLIIGVTIRTLNPFAISTEDLDMHFLSARRPIKDEAT